MSTELVSTENAPTLLRPVTNVRAILEAQEEATALITGVLKHDVDYGKIPGTNKPTLYKAGAERLCNAFGLYADYIIEEQEINHVIELPWAKQKKVWNNAYKDDRTFTMAIENGVSLGLYRYVVKCRLVSRSTGEVVGTAIGVCSSLESKYIDRPRDCENTVLKMAEKRALVAASLNTLGLSDRFTQDLEDQVSATQTQTQRPATAQAPQTGGGQTIKGYAAYMRDLAITQTTMKEFEAKLQANGKRGPDVTNEFQRAGNAPNYDALMAFLDGHAANTQVEASIQAQAPIEEQQTIEAEFVEV